MAFSLADMVQGNALQWLGNQQQTPTAVTATNDGLTTGLITSGTSSVLVTSSTSTKYASLPAPVVGDTIVLAVGANGFRLQTSDPTNIGLNGVAGASSYLQIPANSRLLIQCLSATNFLVFVLTNTGGINSGIDSYLGQTISARLYHTGDLPARVSTDGTDATPVNTEVYIAEVFIRANTTINGVAIFNGSVASGNVKVGLADSAGNVVATSASTAMSGTDAYQRVPFTSAYNAKGPGTYYVLLFVDNGTARINTHILGNFGASKQTGQVYATGFTPITPPTTFTTGLGPIASLY